MVDPWKVLLIEDNFDDRLIIRETLNGEKNLPERIPFALTEAETLRDDLDLLGSTCFDVVLLDLRLPDSVGLNTYRRVQAVAPGRPIIILTELRDSTSAMEAMSLGAQDYLVKSQLNLGILTRAIRFAVYRQRHLQEKQVLIDKLQHTLDEIKRLQGLVPICSRCKRVRSDEGYWRLVENYLEEHPDLELIHGLCPDCAEKIYVSDC